MNIGGISKQRGTVMPLKGPYRHLGTPLHQGTVIHLPFKTGPPTRPSDSGMQSQRSLANMSGLPARQSSGKGNVGAQSEGYQRWPGLAHSLYRSPSILSRGLDKLWGIHIINSSHSTIFLPTPCLLENQAYWNMDTARRVGVNDSNLVLPLPSAMFATLGH